MEINIQDERKAFIEWATSKDLIVDHEIWYNGSTKFYDGKTQSSWEAWTEQAKKLEGCAVVPEAEYKEMAQFKDLYKRAIVNAKKRKNQINLAHVAGLGVGSGRAVELCKELNIDPHATDMNVMLEAGKENNHE
ncbi:hypothetical protein F900_02146 [Acinetobacter modestus]|uniref:Uncharacterized protein n=1 Tax=Acinetobacter modestus TaxID=1776740 RepID=N9NEP2_9GAMM|nr:hypothetical protein [Acinetobacter modestus]ENX00475.1 hypothetical protein F900_02146 [Acinetobacter modestus]